MQRLELDQIELYIIFVWCKNNVTLYGMLNSYNIYEEIIGII